MALYGYKIERGKRVIVWNPGRNRDIEDYSNRIGEFTADIEKSIAKNGRARVLDIGCGYGNVLLRLRKGYGDKVETYGINAESRWTLKLIRKFGLAAKIFSAREIDKNLPRIYLGDAGQKLPYPSNYFDVVISVASMQYVKDKAKLLEEVNRILRARGTARIQHSFEKLKMPLEYQQLFEIWKEGKRVPFAKYLGDFKSLKFKHTSRDKGDYLLMRKAPRLDLGLRLTQTIDLNKINPKWWGTKAVYALRD